MVLTEGRPLRSGTAAASWADHLNGLTGWPVAFWRHFPSERGSAEELALATLAFHRRHPSAFVKLSPAGTTLATAYGLRHEWRADHLGRMTVVHRPVQNLADWHTFLQATPDRRVYDYVLDSARLVCRGVPEALVLPTLFNPLTIASQLAGTMLLRDHLQAEPALMHAVLASLAQSCCELIAGLQGCGAGGIYLATQTMSYSSFSPAEYSLWGQPYDAECIAAAASLPCNAFHVHGDDVHLTLPPLRGNWALHYELVSGNPRLNDCISHAAGAAFIGLPSAYLSRRAQQQDRRDFLKALSARIGSLPAVLTPGCCLPLDFPAECLDSWREAAAQVNRG